MPRLPASVRAACIVAPSVRRKICIGGGNVDTVPSWSLAKAIGTRTSPSTNLIRFVVGRPVHLGLFLARFGAQRTGTPREMSGPTRPSAPFAMPPADAVCESVRIESSHACASASS